MFSPNMLMVSWLVFSNCHLPLVIPVNIPGAVQSHPEALKYARELLRDVTFKEGAGLLSVSLDTQFLVRLHIVTI